MGTHEILLQESKQEVAGLDKVALWGRERGKKYLDTEYILERSQWCLLTDQKSVGRGGIF